MISLMVVAVKYKSTYVFLFQSFFGAVILVSLIGAGLFLNTRLGIYIGFFVGLFFILTKILGKFGVEGFGGGGEFESGWGKKCGPNKNVWKKETLDAFKAVNDALYDGVFNINMLQCNATEEEAQEFLKNYKWTWSEDTKRRYIEVMEKNTMLRVDPYWIMQESMTTYTDKAMRMMLEWNSPEGKLLLEGRLVPGIPKVYSSNGTYGLNSGLQTLNQDIVRCGPNGKMMRLVNMENDGITGAHVQKVETVDYRELPKLLPGFSWKGEPCNPCENLDNPPETKCKFSIPPPRKTLIVETNEEKTPWTVSWL